jgi:phage repressor protein C with HTH and peptisase S24 domain
MEPTFVDGSGVDTTHTHYSDVDDVWYFVPREK